MALETPINHSFNVECPKCNHKHLYSVNLDGLKDVYSKDIKKKYEFISYIICKNPVCNYDIELKGYVWEHPENTIDNIELVKTK